MAGFLFQIDVDTIDLAIADLTVKIDDLSQGSRNAVRHFEGLIGSDEDAELSSEERISRLGSVREELRQIAEDLSDEEERDGTELSEGAPAPAAPYSDPLLGSIDFGSDVLVAMPDTDLFALMDGDPFGDADLDPKGPAMPPEDFLGDEEDEDMAGGAPAVLSDDAQALLACYAAEQPAPRLVGPHVRIGQAIPSLALLNAATIARGRMAALLIYLHECEDGAPEPEQVQLEFFEAYEEVCDQEGQELQDDMDVCNAAACHLDEIIENLDGAWSEGIEIPECLWVEVLEPILSQVAPVRLH